eukprot:8863725-Alexandrium_andersonii.AAC.1
MLPSQGAGAARVAGSFGPWGLQRLRSCRTSAFVCLIASSRWRYARSECTRAMHAEPSSHCER